jgi:hypothetical protein
VNFELSGPDGRIILPRIWEATLQPEWTIIIHFRQPRNGDPHPANPHDDIHEYRLELDRQDIRFSSELEQWKRERVQERERWESERDREKLRWERERVLDRERWERERIQERTEWQIQQEINRQQWEDAQERTRITWEQERDREGSVRELTSPMTRKSVTNVNPCLLWLAGRLHGPKQGHR